MRCKLKGSVIAPGTLPSKTDAMYTSSLLLCPFIHLVTGNVEVMAGALGRRAISYHEDEGCHLERVLLGVTQMLP